MLDLQIRSSVSTRNDEPQTTMAYTMGEVFCNACCSGIDPLLGNELRTIAVD
jgi:hypothetical protein